VTTWNRSAPTSGTHVSIIRGTPIARSIIRSGRLDGAPSFSTIWRSPQISRRSGTSAPLRQLVCHCDRSTEAESRTVRTTCTSASPSEAIIRSAASGFAQQRNSIDTIVALPRYATISSASRSQRPPAARTTSLSWTVGRPKLSASWVASTTSRQLRPGSR
jgi:hypothetical protein